MADSKEDPLFEPKRRGGTETGRGTGPTVRMANARTHAESKHHALLTAGFKGAW